MALQTKQIFVNLPVEDLAKSKAFFEHIGFAFNEQFTDENAACLVLGENIFAMLLAKPYFQTFTTKQIADSTTTVEVINALSADSREEVDEVVKRAFAAGAKPYNDPVDHGFMYSWSFQDLDNHLWELAYMDPSALQ